MWYQLGIALSLTVLSRADDQQPLNKFQPFSRQSTHEDALALRSSGKHDSCPVDVPLSCHGSSSEYDSCCYEGTNGVFLLTQFWDYLPATGPDDAWTIHGLWSDRCSGGYNQFCNPSWQISSAQSTLEALDLSDLVTFMNKYWKNQGNSDNSLWTHEFNKHGTCMSSVSPSCYPSSVPAYTNVGDFFKSVVRLYETLPTYEWLKDAGIEPSTDKTWKVSDFTDVLQNRTDGKTVYLGCDRRGNINEVWYFYALQGSVADGDFIFADSVSTSSCTDGFKYLPKGSGNGGGGGGGSTDKGYLRIEGQSGCLISDGSWYSSGTCATYRIRSTVGGISLSSSKGSCGIVSGAFKCGTGVSGGDFELKDGYISYDGSTEWSADNIPSGSNREVVSPEGDGNVRFKIKFVSK